MRSSHPLGDNKLSFLSEVMQDRSQPRAPDRSIKDIMAGLACVNVRHNICQPIIPSLASHSVVHVHKMPTRAVAMAAAPSSSSSPDTILVKAVPYMYKPPFLSLLLSSTPCFLKVCSETSSSLVSVGSCSKRFRYFWLLVSHVS